MTYSQAVETRIQAWRDSLAESVAILKGEPASKTIHELRDSYSAFLNGLPVPDGLKEESVNMGSIPATLVTPIDPDPDCTVVHFHGGAYIFGEAAGYVGLGGQLAKALNARVYIPDYRLAPEFPYPTPILDSLASYRWLLECGVDARSIVLSGDSAGGALTVSVMMHARDRGLPLPAAGLSISPWADLEHEGASMRARERLDPLCDRVGLEVQAQVFLAGAAPNSPDASPIHGDVHGLPPILVQVGEREVLLSDAIRLVEHLAESRVRVSLEVWPDMFHDFQMFADLIPEARSAIESAARFITIAIHNPGRSG